MIHLEDLADNTKTDKNTVHSYLPLYQELLKNKKDAKNILEIGIFKGGSIQLWNNFFTDAIIYGLDIQDIDSICDEIKNNDKIKLLTSINAYDENFFYNNFYGKIKFDFMLDDGPHSLESQIQFIKLYSQLMTDDGILIIEDVQSWDWIDTLKHAVPEHLKQYIKVYDLRTNKNRWDDIVFTIDRFNL